jgi:hypothetical protein
MNSSKPHDQLVTNLGLRPWFHIFEKKFPSPIHILEEYEENHHIWRLFLPKSLTQSEWIPGYDR